MTTTERATFTVNAQSVRVCNICWQPKPIAQFRLRFRSTGERHVECNECRAVSDRLLRQRRREKQLHGFAQAVNRAEGSTRRIEGLLSSMVLLFGGATQFAVAWKSLYDKCVANRKFHLCARHLLAMMNMSVVVARLAARRGTRAESLSNDDLVANLERHLKSMMNENPELVLTAAEEMGWTVIPPDSADDSSTTNAELTIE